MTTGSEGAGTPLATWFAALLVADMMLAGAVAALLVAEPASVSATLATVPPVGLVAAVLIVGVAAVAGARGLWRRGAETAALALALLPLVSGAPYVFFTLGLPF